MDEL
jgi:hypothetical protein